MGEFYTQHEGKTDLSAFQASPRGEEVRLRLSSERVLLAGQAVTALKGELLG